MEAYLLRIKPEQNQTLGVIHVYNGREEVYSCKSMELPWLDNQTDISCIPTGKYDVVKHVSPKFGECFWIKDVHGREQILIHKGNYNRDTKGCILPGRSFADIDNDGSADVTNSGNTLRDLMRLLPDNFKITIV
jgi:Family of unknown function (DUF5675)